MPLARKPTTGNDAEHDDAGADRQPGENLSGEHPDDPIGGRLEQSRRALDRPAGTPGVAPRADGAANTAIARQHTVNWLILCKNPAQNAVMLPPGRHPAGDLVHNDRCLATAFAFVHCTRKLRHWAGSDQVLENQLTGASHAACRLSESPGPRLVIPALAEAVAAVEALFADARRAVADRVTIEGRTVPRIFDREQRATHGLAWLATYVEAIRQLVRLCPAAVRERQFRRDRGTAGAHRRRRIPRPDVRRHPDEPRRDRAAIRSRTVAGRGRRAHDASRRAPYRHRQHGAAPRPPGRADPAAPRCDGRRLRARRHARIRSARKCANSPTTASCPMRNNGT